MEPTIDARHETATVFRIERVPSGHEAAVEQLTSYAGQSILALPALPDEGPIDISVGDARIKLIAEELVAEVRRPATFHMEIPAGCRVMGLPFDVEWHTPGVPIVNAHIDGEALVFLDRQPFAANGVGIRLTAPDDALVSVTPHGDGQWFWGTFASNWNFIAKAGLGVAVFADGQPEPLVVRRAQLFAIYGSDAFRGERQYYRFADALVGTGGPFAPSTLAPVLFHARAGQTYTAWAWVWHQFGGRPDGVIDGVTCDFKTFVVCAGPAPPIR